MTDGYQRHTAARRPPLVVQKEAKVEKTGKTEMRNDEVTQPTVVEVDKVYTAVVLGKVLLRTNGLKSLRLEVARSMPLHVTELVSQLRGDSATRA
jgi:hypothetical protein